MQLHHVCLSSITMALNLFFCFIHLSKLFEFCLLYPSVLSVVQSPCVLISAVCHLIDCIFPQVFSIVCHYLPVSVLFILQLFSCSEPDSNVLYVILSSGYLPDFLF